MKELKEEFSFSYKGHEINVKLLGKVYCAVSGSVAKSLKIDLLDSIHLGYIYSSEGVRLGRLPYSALLGGCIKTPIVSVFTDGACIPNPGKGGTGVILKTVIDEKEYCKTSSTGYKLTTNNRMELLAAIEALEMLKKPSIVNLYSDSMYLLKPLNAYHTEGVKSGKKANKDLWQKLEPLLELHNVSGFWVKGHSGHKENERCDELANAATKRNNLQIDEGYSLF